MYTFRVVTVNSYGHTSSNAVSYQVKELKLTEGKTVPNSIIETHRTEIDEYMYVSTSNVVYLVFLDVVRKLSPIMTSFYFFKVFVLWTRVD